ncbi:M15 family metallopeptidase [Xylanimonas protaetiae]|uniref:D-alanyl-D-alanine carboxypeptidase family protein n=1 Tax=Xylanimonas protaetiae TaxID=2509457 RepID=A0A4P6F6K6_9MICO|nr:M15 family metallopeptidase [Xylanimonas protaetiae]QAY71075.1 D-alanyl-D-alanine carboxypeptidase family protein [Xylanimonas protaetiae]
MSRVDLPRLRRPRVCRATGRRATGPVLAFALCSLIAAPSPAPSPVPEGPAGAAATAQAPTAATDLLATTGLRTTGAAQVAPAAMHPQPLDPGDGPLLRTLGTGAPADPQASAWRAAADDPASTLVVVDKRRPLDPEDFVPADLRGASGVLLRADASDAFLALAAAAEAAGVPVRAQSGYRSFVDQQVTYHRWQRELGDARADEQSARPGHSEHQTGLALDVLPRGGACQAFGCFGATPQAAWLAAHAAEYGFVVRYQDGQEPVTGYTAEPWHLRYVGVAAASALAASGARSIEEYLGLPAAPTY